MAEMNLLLLLNLMVMMMRYGFVKMYDRHFLGNVKKTELFMSFLLALDLLGMNLLIKQFSPL